jgi:hypothetical protein
MSEYNNEIVEESDEDDYTYTSSMNQTFNRLRIRKPGLFTIKRKIANKTKTMEYYETKNIPNARIVNAITGFAYISEDPKIKYIVGSKYEDYLFKVKLISGEDKNASAILFYDSPEQYERHQFLMLAEPIKQKWQAKQMVRK